jgi:hypothetical protein
MRGRSHRSRGSSPKLTNAWVSLGFLILMLVMLVLMKQRVAESAAGCFTRMSDAPGEDRIVVPREGTDKAGGNVLVVPPAAPDAGVTVPE